MTGRKGLALVTLLLVFSVSNLANATVAFQPPVSYPAGPVPVAVTIGDFNGDGNPDLAVANHGDPSAGDNGNLSILLGNGDGPFQAASNILAGKNPQSLAVGDFNGDGKLDLAVLNSDDTVSVSLGNGDGTFQARVDYATSTGSLALNLDDVNGDQRSDLQSNFAGAIHPRMFFQRTLCPSRTFATFFPHMLTCGQFLIPTLVESARPAFCLPTISWVTASG
jgi:FG-GAP-like repeat